MRLQNVLLIFSVLALFVVAGCTKPIAGQAISGFSDGGCVKGPWSYKDGSGQYHNFKEGCTTEFADRDENGNPIPWCTTKTVKIRGYPNLYISGNGQGTQWKECSKEEIKVQESLFKKEEAPADKMSVKLECSGKNTEYSDEICANQISKFNGKPKKCGFSDPVKIGCVDNCKPGEDVVWCGDKGYSNDGKFAKNACKSDGTGYDSLITKGITGCPIGTSCDDKEGKCVKSGDGTGNCPAGTTPCGPKKDCIGTTSDPSNCGGCGNWCFDSKKYPGVKDTECIKSVCVTKGCKSGFVLQDGFCLKKLEEIKSSAQFNLSEANVTNTSLSGGYSTSNSSKVVNVTSFSCAPTPNSSCKGNILVNSTINCQGVINSTEVDCAAMGKVCTAQFAQWGACAYS